MFESNIDIVLTEISWSNLSFLGGVDSAVSGMMERASPLPYWTNISQGGTTSGPSFQCFGFSDFTFHQSGDGDFIGRQPEEKSENTQWRKAQQMQPVQLCNALCSVHTDIQSSKVKTHRRFI